MENLKKFFQTIYKSAFDLAFYQKELMQKTFGQALGYLYIMLALSFFVGFVPLTFQMSSFSAKWEPIKKEIIQYASVLYPKDLKILVQNGEVMINQPEPYSIKIPKNKYIGEGLNLITFDSKASVDDYRQYQTMVLVTKNSVITPKEKALEVYPIEQNLNLKIDYSLYLKIFNQVKPYLDKVPQFVTAFVVAGLIFGPFIIGFFGVLGLLIALLFVGFFFWLLALILKKQLSFGKVYTLSMYGVTGPVVLSLFINLLATFTGNNFLTITLGALPRLYFLVLMILVIANSPKK